MSHTMPKIRRRLFPRRWIEKESGAWGVRGNRPHSSGQAHTVGLRPVINGGKAIDLRSLLAGLAFCFLILGCAGTGPSDSSLAMRDFPPLVDPDRPAPEPSTPAVSAELPSMPLGRVETLPDTLGELRDAMFDDDAYRLGVGDELQIMVTGNPEFNRPTKVLPDGSITAPGVGSLYVMGETAGYASGQITQRLRRLLRHPDVDVLVTAYGEHVVYVTGEVELGGDIPFRKGMTALQAVAAAGGFKNSANRDQVVVFRRTDTDEAEFHTINLDEPLDGSNFENDMRLYPYDIVYVPKSFIGNVNMFVDQWFRQNIAAFTFYLAGWDAYSVTKDRVIISDRNRR